MLMVIKTWKAEKMHKVEKIINKSVIVLRTYEKQTQFVSLSYELMKANAIFVKTLTY